ncbi:hypothetical protein J8273_4556 [Carpediemonas membranifera]|uniref:Uncharacterized protein n=1 Tax=Carpediemonas membranifera TaxID=201153 RepID=A0A8J6E271_9EUKA|nr:hypothetical protein J8273_4556 [Carpediemonas membranifera]|eukprot:KAG9393956.1 hypothetical protein J8273_4556 [Carpediemonas membranifera]
MGCIGYEDYDHGVCRDGLGEFGAGRLSWSAARGLSPTPPRSMIPTAVHTTGEHPINYLTAATDAIFGVELFYCGIVLCGNYSVALRAESKRKPKMSDLLMGISIILTGVMSFTGAKNHSTTSIAEARPYWITTLYSGLLSGYVFCLGCVADYALIPLRLAVHAVIPTFFLLFGFILIPAMDWKFLSFGIAQAPMFLIGLVYSIVAYLHSHWVNSANIIMIVLVAIGIVVQAVGNIMKFHLSFYKDFDYNVVFHLYEMAVFFIFLGMRLSPFVQAEHATKIPRWNVFAPFLKKE